MRFAENFELQKIPEWYNMYFHYTQLRKTIESFKEKETQEQVVKLPGLYVYLRHRNVLMALDLQERSNG